jgi:hypothetical protein
MTLVFTLIATMLFTATAPAAPPRRFSFAIDDTFPSSFLSLVCGFDVFIHLEGTANAKLFFDRNGTLIREIDTQPNLRITFFAPSTGKSFTYPVAGAFIQDYSGGSAVGDPVIATLTGVLDGTGSTPPDAGRLVINAVVIDISPEGIPVVDFVSEISASGHFNEDVAAARCATLSDP